MAVAFRRIHGHWPRRSSSDPIEYQLALFLDDLRGARRADLHESDVALLTRSAFPWAPEGPSGKRQERQLQRAHEAVSFLSTHGRWPRLRAKDAYERKLAHFLSHLRRTRRSEPHRLAEDTQTLLDAVQFDWEPHRGRPPGRPPGR